MGDRIHKKRALAGLPVRPVKKRKKQVYHSDSESDAETNGAAKGQGDFTAVNLMDSDDDIQNAKADEGDSGSGSSSDEEDTGGEREEAMAEEREDDAAQKISDPMTESGWHDASENSDYQHDEDDDVSLSSGEDRGPQDQKSKRNDPSAFASSLSKILSTKLSTAKRQDPVLARSSAAQSASRAAVDSVLESRAKRKLKEQKRKALERGRVRDVLAIQDNQEAGLKGMTAAQVAEEERRLRKVAQRGVVRLFNAVRAAQVKGAEAGRGETLARKGEKVNEMSRKGFLELIASGGGGLSKKPLQEA